MHQLYNIIPTVKWGEYDATELGNRVSSRSRPRRQSTMDGTTTSSSSSVLSPENFNFSPVSPAPITLTPDQVKHCTHALNLLNDKLHAPHTISQEFAHLQVRALIHYSKNQKTLRFNLTLCIVFCCFTFRQTE